MYQLLHGVVFEVKLVWKARNQVEFGPYDKAKCDELYDHLLKTFGTREKLDYCLAYAGAALQGRSAVTSCSAMFHVGI